jgi:hypothetical protein
MRLLRANVIRARVDGRIERPDILSDRSQNRDPPASNASRMSLHVGRDFPNEFVESGRCHIHEWGPRLAYGLSPD